MRYLKKYKQYSIKNQFVINFSGDTTESELSRVFSAFGNVKSTKIIVDRAGVSKGYGFVTFETEQEAQRLQNDVSLTLLVSTVYHRRNLPVLLGVVFTLFHI